MFAAMGALGVRSASASQFVLQKQQNYEQESAASSSAAVMLAPFSANGHVPSQATLLRPGLSAVSLDSSNGVFVRFNRPYPTKTALDGAFPNGSYSVTGTSMGTVNINLAGDLYPSPAPQILGGTWQNGVLMVDPTQNTVLNLGPFTGYGTLGVGSNETFQLVSAGPVPNDGVNLVQEFSSVQIPGVQQSPTPFSSYTIPAGALKAGGIYRATLSYSSLADFDTTQVSGAMIASLYNDFLTFYVVANPATAVAAPSITSGPNNVVAPSGGTVTFTVAVSSQTPSSTIYFWYFNGIPIDVADTRYSLSGASLTIGNVSQADAGTYAVTAVSAGGRADSQTATLSIGTGAAPLITTQPANVAVLAGGSFSLTAAATGTGPFTFQWYLNGVAIPNATSGTYTSSSASTAQAGTYTVTVTNSGGTTTSNKAVVTVDTAPVAPSFTVQPAAQSIASGSTVVFSASATGVPAPTYQWQLNGTPLAGETAPRIVIYGATSANAGVYTCVASNSAGSATSSGATLSVASAASLSRLINLSANAFDGVGATAMTVGFVTGGAGTGGSQTVLIRASGPALVPFGVTGVLPDPTLTLFSGSAVIGSNAGWASTPANQAAVVAAEANTGVGFVFSNPASLDSALVATLPANQGYTVQVAGASGDTGTTLAEVYDDTPAGTATPSTPRLINISCRVGVNAGGSVIAGFVVGGSTSKTVLIRASGPALKAFGLSGFMPDPQVQLYSNNAPIAYNAGWGGDSQMAAAMAKVNAFLYSDANSADSALLLTLQPGAYTADVSSVSGTAGTVLVEVYEVP
jgi:hypothetical protein